MMFVRERAGGLQTAWPVLAGLAQAASIAMPGSGQAQGWLQILSLVMLATVLVRIAKLHPLSPRAWRQSAWSSGVFATTWLAGSFWWLYVSMHDVGGLPAALAVVAVLALAAALALYYAVACAVWVIWVRDGLASQRPGLASALFAALWTLAELMRGRWLTGFPWGAGGYAHVDGVLAVWAPWLGVYGIGAIAAWLAMRMALSAWRLQSLKALVLVMGVSLGLQAWGPSFTTSAGMGRVALLQANISQSTKFDAASGIRDALQWYNAQLRSQQQPLIVAPETAIPIMPRYLPDGYWSGLQQHFASKGHQMALLGVPLGDRGQGYTNSVVALGPEGMGNYQYDKSHLVPFGEFIPPGFVWFVRMMNIPLGDFNPGGWQQASVLWQGQRLAPNVCYEDLFGEELAIRFKVPGQAPTAMVNVSNIAWFGDTLAVDQHLSISRMRAMELQRPMLRATNTGATAIIDHQGRVTAQLPRFTRSSLEGEYEGRNGLTPFAWWAGQWGLWPLWGLCCAVLAFGVWCKRKA